MFANHIKLIFVLTAYSPIIFIVWAVEVYNNLTKGNQIGLINKPIEIFNRLNLGNYIQSYSITLVKRCKDLLSHIGRIFPYKNVFLSVSLTQQLTNHEL